MIAGIFHRGSGLGNQLFRYVMTRTLAEDKGFKWGMVNPDLFKGTFIDAEIPFPKFEKEILTWHEKKVVEGGVDIRGYDPEINFVEDNTIIDGEFQDQRYWGHRIGDMRKWLKVKPLELSDNMVIIGFRGGEYTAFPELFLTKDYWEEAMSYFSGKEFKVVTDDPETARVFFPSLEITHDIGEDWRSVRYAKNLIIANSSFYVLPALLNENVSTVIAPRYWARRNTRVWALPQNYYPRFTYI